MNEDWLPASEFDEHFVRCMKNRMTVSFHKYGAVKDAYPHKVDAMESAKVRIERYHETGNTEWLVDAANFLMIEFMLPRHKDAHFEGTDSHASPGRINADGKRTWKTNEAIEVK